MRCTVRRMRRQPRRVENVGAGYVERDAGQGVCIRERENALPDGTTARTDSANALTDPLMRAARCGDRPPGCGAEGPVDENTRNGGPAWPFGTL